MGNLKRHHLIEAGFWLILILFFYYHSFEFDRNIEIYRYGASAWPRGILLLMAVVAIAQLGYNWKKGDTEASSVLGTTMEDSAEKNAANSEHTGVGWYLSTFLLLSLPFIYMNLPQVLAGTDKPNDPTLNDMKLVCAAVLTVIYLLLMWKNHLGGMLALPMLFSAMLQDIGFYSLAPFFIVGVMFLMGERKIKSMAWVMPLIMGLLLLFFVKLLYVGLPTGNIKPFYDIGTGIVTILQ